MRSCCLLARFLGGRVRDLQECEIDSKSAIENRTCEVETPGFVLKRLDCFLNACDSLLVVFGRASR